MKTNKILMAMLLIILTVGAVSASDNATADDIITPEDDRQTIQEETLQNTESASPQKLNASYHLSVDGEYLKDSGNWESNFNIYLYERELMNGNMEIFIDDELKYSAKPALEFDESGYFLDDYFLDRLNLTFGPHKAEFKYSGDELFNGFDETRHFNYTYLKFYLPKDEMDIEAACDFIVKSKDAAGKLKIAVDNKTVYNRKFTGYGYTTFYDLEPGRHTYDIYYTGTGNYKSVERHGSFNVSYEFYAFFSSYDDDETTIDKNVLTISLPYDAKSSVRVVVNNKTYSAAVKKGSGKLTLGNLNIGENIIFMTYSDENYYERTVSKKVTVLPALDFTYSQSGPQNFDAKAKLTMPENANGTLRVEVDSRVFTCKVKNGTATIALDMVKPGIHNFRVSYTGDYEQYVKNETYENINVYERDIISIEEDKITLELPKGETGTLTIKINDKTEKITIKNKTGYTYPLKLKEGIWKIKVTYKGKTITQTKSDTIDTKNKYFTLSCPDYCLKDDWSKTANLYYKSKSVSKGITAYIDSKKVKVSSYGEIDLSKLRPGTHTVKVEYRNTKNVLLQTLKKKITVADYSYPKFELKDASSAELNANPIFDTITLADNTNLVMNMDLKGNVKGTVTVYKTFVNFYDDYEGILDESVIEKYKSFNLNKGKATVKIPTKILSGIYSFKFVINLNDGNELESSFITSWQPKVTHPEKMTCGENKTLAIYLPGLENTTVGMFGPFKPIYSKVINGKATFSLSTLPVRDGMPVTFAYAGKNYENPDLMQESYTLKLNVQDKSEKINALYSGETVYSLDVSKIYGKTVKPGDVVKFKIGTKKINVKINRKGIANLKIPNSIKPGEYTLKAAYKSGKIIKTLTIKHVVSLKAVKVKKYAKKLVLTATLKKISGKYLKGKKITFTFNGKKYTAKTNKMGVAKVTVKRAVLYRLWVGKKVAYSATYLKDTVKRTAKVKR